MEPEALFILQCEKDFLCVFPGAWWYKIPDGPVSGKRPFDVMAIAIGIPFCFEMKVNTSLTLYQKVNLDRTRKNGAKSYLVTPQNLPTILNAIRRIR